MSAGWAASASTVTCVQVVGHQHRLFGREVTEEGAGRDVGGLGDLFDGGVGVAVRVDEPHGLAPDGVAGLDLLSVPQTQRWFAAPMGGLSQDTASDTPSPVIVTAMIPSRIRQVSGVAKIRRVDAPRVRG